MQTHERLDQVTDRYEAIIEEKEDLISDLESRPERSEAYADTVAWDRHRKAKNNLNLPVPRLQIELTVISSYEHHWFYTLIYRHTTGDLMAVPMGETSSKGSHNFFKFDSKESAQNSLPFRDGVHIRRDSWQLKLPAYAVFGYEAYLLDEISDD